METFVEQDSEYSDYSDAALLALSEIEEGNFVLEKDQVVKDLDYTGLRELYRQQTIDQIDQYKESISDTAGEYKNYIDFLLQGGDPEVLKETIKNRNVLSLETDGNSSEAIEARKQVLQSYYVEKGLSVDDAEEMTESQFDKGRDLEKVAEAKEYFTEKEDRALKQNLIEKENYENSKDSCFRNKLKISTVLLMLEI